MRPKQCAYPPSLIAGPVLYLPMNHLAYFENSGSETKLEIRFRLLRKSSFVDIYKIKIKISFYRNCFKVFFKSTITKFVREEQTVLRVYKFCTGTRLQLTKNVVRVLQYGKHLRILGRPLTRIFRMTQFGQSEHIFGEISEYWHIFNIIHKEKCQSKKSKSLNFWT